MAEGSGVNLKRRNCADPMENERRIVKLRKIVNDCGSVREYCEKYGGRPNSIKKMLYGFVTVPEKLVK